MSKPHVYRRAFWQSLLWALCFLSCPAWAKVETIQNGGKTTLRIEIDSVDFKNIQLFDQSFVEAKLRGVEGHEGILHQEGEPEIPVVRFLVPGTPSVRRLDALTTMGTISTLYPIKPSQPSRPKIRGVEWSLTFNAQKYEREDLFPAKDFDIEDAGSRSGIPQTLVTLYPLSYAPKTGSYTLSRSFEITYATPKESSPQSKRFIFVVGEKFAQSPSLAEYINVKKEAGFTVGQINVTRRMKPEDIRGQLREIYKKTDATLTYALIIGDGEDVPGKPSKIISGVTDHFYRCIDTGTYDSDINGPDIGVGRVAVKTEEELRTVLEKFTRYSKGDFSSNDWLQEVSFLATNDRWQVAEGTHNYVIESYTKNKGYTGIFPQAGQKGGDQLYAITHRVSDDDVREALGLGRSIINYSGHGANTYWDAPRFEKEDVERLSDPDALPFVIANACITGDYRVSESFGETWQKHPNGAITYWGSMDSTYWDEDDILERRMYDGIFKGEKRTFGEITEGALSALWTYYGGKGFANYYWETYVLFGDPSLNLRIARPGH